MRALVLGNMGYIGPVLVQHFWKNKTFDEIIGLDTGYFAHVVTSTTLHPDHGLSHQIYKDVRQLCLEDFNRIDVVVYLAAISNDPMGNEFGEVTLDVNQRCARKAADLAKASGAHSFVFASSCSVYGLSEDCPRAENAELNPLTTYAKSKIRAEKLLMPLASTDFKITCLRFATACGFSPRLRLDLVLNDFVASAQTTGKIEILSDGTPWRPLIHVSDMARAIEWASLRDHGEHFLVINTGSNCWNYQIRELADEVAQFINDTHLHINPDAAPDNRSYQVDFSLFRELAPDHQPLVSLQDAVKDLYSGLERIGFCDTQFRNSAMIRLKVLHQHRENGHLDKSLIWT